MTNLPHKDIFRPKEVAEYLCLSKRTIYRWIEEGRLEAIKLPGGSIRVAREAIEDAQKGTLD